ncbi:MAG: helix-turn-helix transcriptional regulator [Clostridia bacterium]|nr:helix-turn-helix transcriptional regulator [Clostridia bacterium]
MVDFDFGNRLKELRLQAGLTQKQLADQLGITKSVVSFYELRERTPSPEVLIKLAAVFHVSSDFLLGIERGKSLDITGLNTEDEKILRLMVEHLRNKNS